MQRDISTCFGAWNMESDSRASLTLFLRAISAEIHLQFGFLSPFLSLHATLKRCALYSTKNYYLINNVAAIKKQRTQKYSNEYKKKTVRFWLLVHWIILNIVRCGCGIKRRQSVHQCAPKHQPSWQPQRERAIRENSHREKSVHTLECMQSTLKISKRCDVLITKSI